MKSRRSFIKHAGQATALGCLGTGTGLAAVSGRIAIITVSAGSPPVNWAVGQLRTAIESRGASCAIVDRADKAGDFSLAVVIGGESVQLPREGFRLSPAKVSAKP